MRGQEGVSSVTRNRAQLYATNNSSTLVEERGLRLPVEADLFQHSMLIPIVPAFNNLSIENARDADASDSNRFATGQKAHGFSSMGHCCRPSHHNLVIRPENVFDFQLHIGKRGSHFVYELYELLRPANFGIRSPLSPCDRARRKQVVNSLNPALIPHFLEPASHQLNVFLEWHWHVLLVG